MKINDLLDAVMQLDLEPIKMKLMHVASGEGWSKDKTNAVEREYRRFLCLMKMFSEEEIAPLVDVDTFWHYHILDTMKYAADCENVFGHFLHHYPYVGMRGGDDEQVRLDSGERMRALYEATFGDAYPGMAAAADGTHAAYCAGPHAEAAYCAGPHVQAAAIATAYCAGPHVQAGRADDAALATAYCAGPHVAATAYCAGPHAETAYCAGPHTQARRSEAAVAATAYCAGPHVQAGRTGSAVAETAYCAGPHTQTAYCAGPHVQARRAEGAVAATAYCAGPHVQARRADSVAAATAYCAGPHVAAGQEADMLLAA